MLEGHPKGTRPFQTTRLSSNRVHPVKNGSMPIDQRSTMPRSTIMKEHHRPHSPTTFFQLLMLIVIALAAVTAMVPRNATAAPAQLDLEFDSSDNTSTLNSFLA